MADEVVVFGYGPVGHAVTELLAAQGRTVRVAQRRVPTALPRGARFVACDALDPAQTCAAAAGAAAIVAAVGLPYRGRLWLKQWPRVMTSLVRACEASGARMVFVDNLYLYGPQSAPLREDMPLTRYGRKPRARAEATRIWQRAAADGRARVAALRASDFYGPGVTQSILGASSIGALARGGRAGLAVPPDLPHDFVYVPDFARAVLSLLDAPDDAYGQAWHVPCAPIRSVRALLDLAAKALECELALTVLPPALLPLLGLFSPMLGELAEMRFQWQAPYRVDWSKFAARFWSDPTPFESGIPATALSFLR